MSKRRGHTSRRDAMEKPIRQALEACGVRTWQLTGKGNPDVLTLWQGRYLPLEVKSEDGKKTPAQAGIPWPVVRTVTEALVHVGVKA